jgi:hypothetical protein
MKDLSYKYQRPSYQVPKKTLLQKYPRGVGGLVIFTTLSIFFSRQIYDIFLRPEDDFVIGAAIPPPHKR